MMRQIEARLGRTGMESLARQAITPAAKIVHKNMANSMQSFRDTGASIDEMQISQVDTSTGRVVVRIYWQGPKDRYRLIHLNEHGYTRHGKRYRPDGFGKIRGALRQSEKPYFEQVKRGLSQ